MPPGWCCCDGGRHDVVRRLGLGHDLIALLSAALAGASLGFAPFNVPTARRSLGDLGAYFFGFTIAGLSVAGFVDSTGRVAHRASAGLDPGQVDWRGPLRSTPSRAASAFASSRE